MISIFIEFGLLILLVVINLVLLFTTAFLERITLVNSSCLAIAGGVTLYLCNRNFDAFFDFKVHPAICFVIALAIFGAAYFLQTTKVGFWIFAVLFSLVWAFALSLIAFLFATQDMIWIYVVFFLSFIINIGSHIRSREYTTITI
jgi:hypothetical protein